MKTIPLSQGRETVVDDVDYEWLMQWKWYVKSNEGDNWYACRSSKGKTIRMHREIIGTTKSMHTDHINGDSLDNRRDNLRTCTHKENTRNRKKQKSHINNFKGVTRQWKGRKKRWQAIVRYNGVNKSLGYYETEWEAAKAYDKGAKKVFGEFARTNEDLGLYKIYFDSLFDDD